MWIGKHGIYLIAEIGGNHEGDFYKAKKLTELACATGVDAVKFQIYTADTLVSKVEDPERYTHFKKFELTPEQHISLAEICKKNKVTYLASVWDMNALEWIDPYIKFYKIGSGDLTAYPILERIAKIGKPIIISTGLATIEEVRESVACVRSIDDRYMQSDYLALLQCTSSYPLPECDVNLRVMKTLKNEFNVTVGYSDHTVDSYAAEVAVSMDASILEFHFTDDKKQSSFRDHQVSFTAKEIKDLIDKIKRIKKLQGSSEGSPTQSEIESGNVHSFRRDIYAAKDLQAGDIITESALKFLRPDRNSDITHWRNFIGRTLDRPVAKYQKISSDFIS